MNRRNFLKRFGGLIAVIPIVGKLVRKDPDTVVIDGVEWYKPPRYTEEEFRALRASIDENVRAIQEAAAKLNEQPVPTVGRVWYPAG